MDSTSNPSSPPIIITIPAHVISSISRMALAQQGKMMPIRKQDIMLKLRNTKLKYKDVIEAVNRELALNLGIELVQCPSSKKKFNTQTSVGREASLKENSDSITDKMILRTISKDRIPFPFHDNPSELLLLYLSLGCIHLSHGTIEFGELKEFIRVYFKEEEELESFFKRKLKEAYFFKEVGNDKSEMWSFGYRAMIELPPEKIGLMFSDLLSTVDPEAPNHFMSHFE